MTYPETETVIGARSTTFFRLLRSGRFKVPWHQRRYDWTADHVEELLQDIDDAINADRRCYFLGTMILVKSAPEEWRINDGQQRIVTLSLICACLRSLFTDQNDSQRAHLALRVLFDIDENRTQALEQIDRLTPRVTPPRDDKTRYNLMIRGRSIGANGKLTQAWRRIDSFVVGMGLDRSRRFFDFLLQNVEVARLDIPDSVDPNSVYETINCRGKRLDDLDLIRNHLYSYFNANDDASRRDLVHENLEGIRTQLRDDSKFTDYARCYFQCRYGFLQKSAFYRETRRRIQSQGGRGDYSRRTCSDYVYGLVEDFSRREYVELFRSIATPSHGNQFVEEFIKSSGHTNKIRNLAVFLREMHTYTVTQPLLFALLSHYVKESNSQRRRRLAKWIHARLKHVTAFVMRTAFVAPKFEPSHFESEFSNLAEQVMSAKEVTREIGNAVEVCLRDCDGTHGVMDDKKFKMKMYEIEMRDAKKIRRLLFGVNSQYQPDADLMSESRCTIEHILPKGPEHWDGWREFEGAKLEEWVHRIGNLTLLGRHDNRPGTSDNCDFAAKKTSYLQSAVRITRDVGEHDDWSPKAIANRQRRLVNLAARIWSFDPV